MKSNISLRIINGVIRIYINELLHLSLRQDNLLGIQSYVFGYSQNDYRIEFYLKETTIIVEYDTKDKWEQILRLIDQNNLINAK